MMAVTQTIVITKSDATWVNESEVDVDIQHIMPSDDWVWLRQARDNGWFTVTREVNDSGNELTITRDWTDEGWTEYENLSNTIEDRKTALENAGPEWSITETHS